MIKNKKIIFSTLSIAALITPIASVIACTSCDGGTEDTTGVNKLFDQTRQSLRERLDFIAKTDATTLKLEDPNFKIDFSTPLTAQTLGLVFANNALPTAPIITFKEDYFVEAIKDANITVRASVTASNNLTTSIDASGANISQTINPVTNSTFLTINKFEMAFDLSTWKAMSPFVSDASFNAIPNASEATSQQIQDALEMLVSEYLNLQVPGLALDSDYEITKYLKENGDALTDDNLKDNARSFKLTIRTKGTKLQNQTDLIIKFPQLNAFDLSKMDNTFATSKDNWNIQDRKKVPSSEAIRKTNEEIIAKIKESNSNVTWDDLFAFYYLKNTLNNYVLPQTFDLTNSSPVVLTLQLIALPDSNNVIKNIEITVTLPIFASEEANE